MHRVFITYHHANDQGYKDELVKFGDGILFEDASVDTGDVSDELNDQSIRQIIRDDYLKDSSVTILLVGLETKTRKHIDWELYSSMYDGLKNKRSGIVVIQLPETGGTYFTASHGDEEKSLVYPENKSWTAITERTTYEERYPYLPDRIIDNLLAPKAKISVTTWDKALDATILGFLIDAAYQDRQACEYDLSRRMKRANG